MTSAVKSYCPPSFPIILTMSSPTPFQNLFGKPRHELELAIFEGIIDQSQSCPNCKDSLTSLLKQVSQIHTRTPVQTTDLEPLEIFSYSPKDKVIVRHKLADQQNADFFIRPTVTRMSVSKALYLDIEGSVPVPGIPAPRGFPNWHKTVLTAWSETIRMLDAGGWADRFVFEVLAFEYRTFFKVGDSKDLFVSSFVLPPGPHRWWVGGEWVYDCIHVANDSDDEMSDEDRPDQPVENLVDTSLNEASCQLLVTAYWNRTKTFHLPPRQDGIADCQCEDYLEFRSRLIKTTRPTVWVFEKIFRIMFLRILGATKAMAQGGLEFRGSEHGIYELRELQGVVEDLTDNLGYALTGCADDRWFEMFNPMFFVGREVEEKRYADERLPETGPRRWGLDENGELVRIGGSR
jgi:hypothetical protein